MTGNAHANNVNTPLANQYKNMIINAKASKAINGFVLPSVYVLNPDIVLVVMFYQYNCTRDYGVS